MIRPAASTTRTSSGWQMSLCAPVGGPPFLTTAAASTLTQPESGTPSRSASARVSVVQGLTAWIPSWPIAHHRLSRPGSALA